MLRLQPAHERDTVWDVLLPVGDRDEALLALWLVLPDLGSADPRALLDAALSGAGESGGFVTSPRRARLLDPLAWRRNGYALTGRALLVRRGRLLRYRWSQRGSAKQKRENESSIHGCLTWGRVQSIPRISIAPPLENFPGWAFPLGWLCDTKHRALQRKGQASAATPTQKEVRHGPGK